MKTISGDLIEIFDHGEYDAVIHGCNCMHTMGAGIAKSLNQRFPQVLAADKAQTEYGDYNKLSNFSVAHLPKGKFIVNLYTQYFPGRDLSEKALYLGLEKLTRFVLSKTQKILIPAIGCGLAGGDWDIIKPNITEILKPFDVTFVKYKVENNLIINKEVIMDSKIDFDNVE